MSLTWQHLADQLDNLGMDSTAITVTGGKVIIDPSGITGDAHGSLSNALVLEFLTKFVNLCRQAQIIYNENNQNPINVINAPFMSTPTTDTDGSLFITKTQSFQVRMNINTDVVLGVN